MEKKFFEDFKDFGAFDDFEDDWSEIEKKIDELSPVYCERFNTVSYRDGYCVDEQQVYQLMSRSLDDGVDYLSQFLLEYPDEDGVTVDQEMISSIVQDSDARAEEALKAAFERLSLYRFASDECYSVLAYVYHELQYAADGEEEQLFEWLNKLPVDELLLISEPYLWQAPELEQLRTLRQMVLNCALNKYNAAAEEEYPDEAQTKQEGARLRDMLFLARNKYGNRDKILAEAEFLMSEIEKDLAYLSSDGDDVELSLDLMSETTEGEPFEYKSFGAEPNFFKMDMDDV